MGAALMLPAQDNHILLEKVYLLFRAADDILINECHDLYVLVRDCMEQEKRKQLNGRLGVFNSALSESLRILNTLLQADRASWNP